MASYYPEKVAKVNITYDPFAGSESASFDAVLYKSITGPLHYKLEIQLRVRLEQINPGDPSATSDASGNPAVYDATEQELFPIRPWTGTDWWQFINGSSASAKGAKAQAAMWNNRFSLKPPEHVTDFDITDSRGTWRHFVDCELEVVFEASKANAHRIVNVANLDTAKIASGPFDGSRFISHGLLFDSLDDVPYVCSYGDDLGTPQSASQLTIAHELGHALGLGHIGQLRKSPLCMSAVVAKTLKIDHPHPRGQGGRNALFCYGWDAPRDVGQNIMGGGDQFTEDNARPWLWAMAQLRPWEPWQVVRKQTGPALVRSS